MAANGNLKDSNRTAVNVFLIS